MLLLPVLLHPCPSGFLCRTASSPCKRAVCLCLLRDTKNTFFCFETNPCPGCDTARPHPHSLFQPHEQEPEPFLHPAPGVPVRAWPQVDPTPRLPSWISISLGYIGKYVPSLLISLRCVVAKLQKLSARESFPNALF